MIDYRIGIPTARSKQLKQYLLPTLTDADRYRLIIEDTSDQHPYMHCRTMNAMLRKTPADAAFILMCDDVGLIRGTFRQLASHAEQERAIIAPGIVGNNFGHEKLIWDKGEATLEMRWLPFPCVAIPPCVRKAVGEFDERFDAGYGYDDHDYGERARNAGFRLIVDHRWKIAHDIKGKTLRSAWRLRSDHSERLWINRRVFRDKWGYEAPI